MSVALVTGGAGFLGSRLVRLLAARGERVRAFDLPRASWSRLDGVRCDRAIGDVTDRSSLERAMGDVDRVFHVAALYELGTRDPARMHAINVGGTVNVLDVANDALVVHVSTVAALGPTEVAPRGEEHWNDEPPRSAYAATKREAHLRALERARSGARVRLALPATIYGPGDPSMLGRAQSFLARTPVVPIARAGMRLCFVHVDDCADGVARVADHGRDGESYVLCSDVVPLAEWTRAVSRSRFELHVPDRLLDAASALAARAPASLRARSSIVRVLHEAAAMSASVHWSFRGDKARRELGWSPRRLQRPGAIEPNA